MKLTNIILSVLFVCLFTEVRAQSNAKVLQIEDVTPELSVYPDNDRHEALVLIRCQDDFASKLEFSSNVDKEISVRSEVRGSEYTYYLVFKTQEEGTTFKGRVVTIIAPDYQRLYLKLELTDKQKMEYLLTDPYSALRSPYYINIDKANNMFIEGMYLNAKDLYKAAQLCPEYVTDKNTSVDLHIQYCDSLIYWDKEFNNYLERNDLTKANVYVTKMYSLNSQNQALLEQYRSFQQRASQLYTSNIENGILYMNEGEYEKAQICFQNSRTLGSARTKEIEDYLFNLDRIFDEKKNRSRFLFYQYDEMRPIGFTYAKCNQNKSGGYFSMSIDNGILDLAAQNVDTLSLQPDKFQYSAAISFGWTVRVFAPYVWATFTPFGYTGGGWATAKRDETNYMSETEEVGTEYNWYHAWSPEVGVILKYWRLSVNYKYKANIVLNSEDGIEDLFSKQTHSIGIGFCW